jgi:segregation and condensation protein A
MFQVVFEKFEGPLDLLLELIEKEELDITRLSLSRVADSYLEYVRSSPEITLENLSDFVNVASRIILIKSQAILPTFEVTEEEEEEIKDLEEQLRTYKKFKTIARILGNLFALRKTGYSREYMIGVDTEFSLPKNLSPFDLSKSMRQVINEIPVMEKLPEENIGDVVTLGQKMRELVDSIRERSEHSFTQYIASAADKIEVIVSFLALLELIKQKIISADQNELFCDITIKNPAKQNAR